MNKQIIEIVTPRIRDTYNLLKNKTDLEVQLFGDRIDIAVNNSGSDTETVEKILLDNSINVIDKRTKSVSLENVFINLIQHQ